MGVMTAAGFSQYGSEAQLELRQVPKPIPKAGEMLIRVCASSINSWDWEFLSGVPLINRLMYGLLKPRADKQILGADIAGVVEAVGSQVSAFTRGDRVFGDLWDSWGGFAEYVCASERNVVAMPENASFEEAAAVPQAGVLALQAVRKARSLEPGSRVLVNGAGGGVGTFAIQLAKLAGAQVTGVDAAHKLAVVREAGADHVIDYQRQDFTRTGLRYDLIVDCQNFRSMAAIRRALNPDGTFAMVGGSIPRVYELWLVNLLAWFTREGRQLCLVAEGPNKGLEELKRLIETGRLKPVIGGRYPLAAIKEAMRCFGAGRHKGKIVITMQP